jgi:hypothetical protein
VSKVKVQKNESWIMAGMATIKIIDCDEFDRGGGWNIRSIMIIFRFFIGGISIEF